MIKNYVLTAIRLVARQRVFAFINVAGLTVGITCSLLLILYIEDELNYDRFHPDAKRMYRIGFRGKLEGNEFNSAETGAPLALTLQKEIPAMKDFNFRPLKQSIQPMVIIPGRQPNLEMAIRITDVNSSEVLARLKTLWMKYAPDAPFEYSFVADNFKKSYDSEEKISEVFPTFTLTAILIASLGLLGLATYTAEQRSKEIGIRKVLGSSVGGIVVLIAKDFVNVVLIAFIFASPLSWWALDQWLDQYPYRITIEWWVFGISSLLAFAVALVTVSSQAVKAAFSNPVKSLRNE